MEKTNLTAQVNDGRYEYSREVSIVDDIIRVRAALTRKEREEMALEQATAVLVFDEESGLVYEGYNRDLAEMVCVLRRYTDINLSPYEDADGRYVLYDILESHGAMRLIREIVEEDLDEVLCIYSDLRAAAQRTFERKHSLNHLIKTTLGSILGGGDIAETIAKAQELNGNLIDMLGALSREKAGKPGGGMLNFAKKE